MAWPLIAMAIAGAIAKQQEAKAANREKTQTWNQTQWREPFDFYNWAFTPEQNKQNFGNIFAGDIMSIAQNLLRYDLGGFLTGGPGMKGKGGGGGAGKRPVMRYGNRGGNRDGGQRA